MDVAIRPVEAIDYADVMRLAPRLLVGVDPSRSTVSVSAEDHWCGQADAWVGELMVDQRFKGRSVDEVTLTRQLPRVSPRVGRLPESPLE